MFSTNHIIWLIICFALIGAGLYYLLKKRPPLRQVLNIACYICIASEVIKVFSVIKMVPSSDGSLMFPYLELTQLPLHLCSMQILFIFFARYAKDSRFRENLLAFMYPTCGVGAAFALFIPIIFGATIDVSQAFTHPLAYQYFLYHVMLILAGMYIPFSGEFELKPRHYLTTIGFLSALAFISLYFNSMFATPTYVDGQLVSVDYATNFYFTYTPPIDIPLTEIGHWYIYFSVIAGMAISIIALFYLPIFIKYAKANRRNK